jgi:hypothetical protein
MLTEFISMYNTICSLSDTIYSIKVKNCSFYIFFIMMPPKNNPLSYFYKYLVCTCPNTNSKYKTYKIRNLIYKKRYHNINASIRNLLCNPQRNLKKKKNGNSFVVEQITIKKSPSASINLRQRF